MLHKRDRKGGNYRCRTEIRELEVTIKHNLLIQENPLYHLQIFHTEEPFFFFLPCILETTKSSHCCKLFWSYGVPSTYAIVCLPLSKTWECSHELPNSRSLIIFFSLCFWNMTKLCFHFVSLLMAYLSQTR